MYLEFWSSLAVQFLNKDGEGYTKIYHYIFPEVPQSSTFFDVQSFLLFFSISKKCDVMMGISHYNQTSLNHEQADKCLFKVICKNA